MRIKILGKKNKKIFLKENCGGSAEPMGAIEVSPQAGGVSGLSPEEAFDAGYAAAINELTAMMGEMIPGGDPAEAEIEVPVAIADVAQLEEEEDFLQDIKSTGEWTDYTIQQLKKKKATLMKKPKRSKAEQKKVRQIQFAINAKEGDYK